MRVLLIGAGAVGARAARQLVEATDVDEVLVCDDDGARRAAVVLATGDKATDGGPSVDAAVDAVLLAGPVGSHVAMAAMHLSAGRPVVSTSP